MKFTENLSEGMERLHTAGAFLTVRDGEKINTMTISWGNIGFEWKMPVFVTLVRETRYTKKLLDNAKRFTVTVPMDDSMKSALAYCGSKSGRDVDKFKECSLEATDDAAIVCPSIVYVCEVVYSQKMDLTDFPELAAAEYSSGNIHTMYYGKIVEARVQN